MAVIGQGYFAQSAILPAIDQLDDVELTALVSGSRHKLEELGQTYNVRTLCDYDQLDPLLASGRIDAVYIAVPNDLHARFAVLAARRGIHVLCEKPMAPTDVECLDMIRACEQSNVKLMIAYRLHFDSANLVAIQLARGGDLGEPRVFSSTFTQQVAEDNTRTQLRRGAGPLYDVGVYCINAARYLFQAEPIEVSAMRFASRDPRFRAVDEAIAVTLRFPNERVAQFTCSFGAFARAHYEVIGTQGFLELDHAYEATSPIRMHVEDARGTRERTFEQRDQVAGEVAYFARCIREDKQPEPGGYEGLADVRIMQAIMASARFGRAVPITPLERSMRPDLGQVEDIAPHPEPALIDVVAATR